MLHGPDLHLEAGDRSGLARIHERARDNIVGAAMVWSLDRLGRKSDVRCGYLAAFEAGQM